jgi:predicted RNA-binding Zn-ribbon protein involved in translation (DUF1610 family)
MGASKFPCTSCGADLVFQPGTTSLTCPYCSAQNEIAPTADASIDELDFKTALAQLDRNATHVESIEAHCKSCNAHVQMELNAASQNCPFCGSNLIATNISQKLIKPGSLLPFKIDHPRARELFRTWLASRWFAPSKLKNLATLEGDAIYKGQGVSGLAGLYMPYWTYDCTATTKYRGERGDDYYVTVPRTVTVNGKRTTQMVRERRTRWSSASGIVVNRFDDVLVIASDALPAKQLSQIETWDLDALVPYQDQYLSGFRTQTYTTPLDAGFDVAIQKMDPVIRQTICSDIGGDHQRIHDMQPSYQRITFKHILVPVWVSAYRYNAKVYRFLINARTGVVTGERPYSAVKITFFVLACLVAIAIIASVAASR